MRPADDDIETITRTVLTTMLEMDVARREPGELEGAEHRLTGCVQITGAWQGAVVLQASASLATQFASRMLAIPWQDVVVDDLCDALAEVTNMIGGNVKSLLPGPSYLSLPSITSGDDFDFRVTGTVRVNEVPFQCESGLLNVLVVGRTESA